MSDLQNDVLTVTDTQDAATPHYGFALIIMFIVGLLTGFLGRPLVMKTEPEFIEKIVVVTATPEPGQTAVAQNNASTEKSDNPTPSLMDLVLSDARHFQGNDQAPVTIVEYSDFRCGYCGRFSTETLPQIRKEYVETNKVRFVYKHLPFLGPESIQAAEASECATEQEKFWPLHDFLFADLATNHTALNAEVLTAMAGKIGLETTAFKSCLDSGRYSGRISQDTMAAQGLGVRGTPGFLVNGIFLSGAQPFEVFQQVIEEQLKAKGK